MMISFPYKVLVEKNVIGKITDTLVNMRLGDSCVIISDPDVQKILGNEIKEELSSSFNVIAINPKSLEKKYLEILTKKVEDYDFLIGMGGGRSIDASKYLAHLADIEWVSFPTILSQKGIVSSIAAINDNKNKISLKTKEPVAVIADLNTIKRAPYRFIAAGAGDVLANISAVEDWRIADEVGKEKYHAIAAKLSLLAAEAVIEHAENIKDRKSVV